MPDVTTLVIVGAVWAALMVLVWALCVAAARGDGQDGHMTEQEPPRRPTVVADTGAIRARLNEALQVLGAERLTLTVDIDGRPSVLASAPGVVEAHTGQGPSIAVPVEVDGHDVATLTAARPAGGPRFERGDAVLLRDVADSVADAMQTAVGEAADIVRSSGSVPVRAPSAMA